VEPLNVWDYERLAAERLERGAHGYYAGGAGDERTLRDNVEAFARWQLRPRVLVDVAACTTETSVLGHRLALPVIVAPVAFQRVAHPDGEVGMATAARDAGTVMCMSTMATSTPEQVAETGVDRWFQLYVFSDRGATRELLARVAAAGFRVLVLTVDTPVLGRRERDFRTGFTLPAGIRVEALGGGGYTPATAFAMVSSSVSWRDIEWLASEAGLPVLVKGVLTAEDGRLACEHGAAGIVVSNHGGRQLDGVSATIDALPEVVEAVDGRLDVLVDGGVRRGVDVVVALALGAKAVLAGRAPLWGLAAGGAAGARHVLALLQAETKLALELVGATSPAEVGRDRVQRRLP
jgi:isopentenyl diphosphate isomerase/L-lactate dehydrogenase-like FMN-dependent dehydrogenase